jgi:hypothetical protein
MPYVANDVLASSVQTGLRGARARVCMLDMSINTGRDTPVSLCRDVDDSNAGGRGMETRREKMMEQHLAHVT